MQINGSMPVHIARAYGVSKPQAARPSENVSTAKPAQPVTATAQVRPTDTHDAPQSSAKIDALVAGRVDQPVDFSATPAAKLSPNATLQLYNRAADRIEAATAVQIGRSLDVTG